MRDIANALQRFNLQMVEELLYNDPKATQILVEITKNLRDGSYGQDYVDAIFQKYRSTYDVYDALKFGQIHQDIMSGRILTVTIELGSCPHKDYEAEKNQMALMGVEKSGPFSATFTGGLGDNDGFLSWSEPIYMVRLSDNKEILIKPGRAPLEVGYTNVETTFNHLQSELWLARWPYHSENITLLANIAKMLEDFNICPIIDSAQ